MANKFCYYSPVWKAGVILPLLRKNPSEKAMMFMSGTFDVGSLDGVFCKLEMESAST